MNSRIHFARKARLIAAVASITLGARAAIAQEHGSFQAYPTFSQATDATSLDEWSKTNLIDGSRWLYIDDRWAVFVQRVDKGENPPFAAALVRFEVTTQTMAGLIGARSLVRMLQVNCSERTDRWVGTTAYAGNNGKGGDVSVPPDQAEWVPFSDPRTAEGSVTDALCRPPS